MSTMSNRMTAIPTGALNAVWPLLALLYTLKIRCTLPWGIHWLLFGAFIAALIFPKINRAAHSHGFRIALAVCSGGILVFSALAGALFYANFSNVDGGDCLLYLNAFTFTHYTLPWNGINGYPFLGHHSEFFCIPLCWLYRMFPSPYLLFGVQFAILFSGWLLLRNKLMRYFPEKASAEYLSVAFAFSPCLIPFLLRGFHGAVFAVPLLVLAGFSFHEKRYKRFCLYLVSLLLVKEVFALTAVMFGIVAFCIRRPLRWSVVPAVLGLSYGAFLKYVFFPFMLGNCAYIYEGYFTGWENAFARFFTRANIDYAVFLMLIAGSWAAFRSRYALLALPAVLLNLALGGRFLIKQSYYLLEPAFWGLLGSALYFTGTTRLSTKNASSAALSIAVTLILSCPIQFRFNTFSWTPFYLHHPHERSYVEALSKVPPTAHVAMGAPLYDRAWKFKLVDWVMFTDSVFEKKDWNWAIIKKCNSPTWCVTEEYARVARFSSLLCTHPDMRIVWQDSVVAVYAKTPR